MDDALSVQISSVRGSDLRAALSALASAAIDVSGGDPAMLTALAEGLRDGRIVTEPVGLPVASGRAGGDPGGRETWRVRWLIGEARRAWAAGDAARTASFLRRLDPALGGMPVAGAAGDHLPSGEQAGRRRPARGGRHHDRAAISRIARANGAGMVLAGPGEDDAEAPSAGAAVTGGAVAAEARLLAGEVALRAAEPDEGLLLLLAAADLFAATPPPELVGKLDALVRAGEAICFLGDPFRYAEVTRRAARFPRARPADPEDGGPRGRLHGSPAGPAAAAADPGTGRPANLLAQIDGFGALFEGRYRDATAALRPVVTVAERPGTDAAELVRASAAALVCGDDGAALRLAVRAEAVARAGGDASVAPRALELKGVAELWRGAHDAAASTALAGVRAAERAGQPNEADNHLAMLALLAALRGDRAACRWRLAQVGSRHGRAAQAGSRRGRPRALGRWALGVLDLLAGRAHEAAARLGGIADPRAGRGHVLVQVMAAPDLVEAAVLAGDPGAARAALTAFDRWAASTGEPLRRALSARCHALLARRGSAEAEAHFREALRLHLAGESEFERARTQLLLGRDLRRRRRPRQAREQVGAALDAFVRCGARPWAEQARAELRVCGGDARPAGGTVPLTAQQLQIARLVAAGATNREVATRLFLSTRTVDHHMRNIFHRLGISSRVALAKMIT
ncbi:LuxR C-terminal-related transcriptional regulator [Catenuloplanes atrovinosus]|uniref:DNA-binding NarL/FixJ family response regulator n=1 Tax=Catenuloplanes atrovinosus TaxID=137266 RepID=A0AAE3YLF8_9ACTN|nr:LuxR C-terminal-related transcriptional regulator [Catenuloplanes atrovinosus]MDR7274682.1 DNA-binding NarL/FixJ family response regulator [Catenuloplanes atrovinosus]